MKLFKRIQFAFKHDIEPVFVVMPFGSADFYPSQFLKYEDAVAFTKKEAQEKPMYGKPGILVKVLS